MEGVSLDASCVYLWLSQLSHKQNDGLVCIYQLDIGVWLEISEDDEDQFLHSGCYPGYGRLQLSSS